MSKLTVKIHPAYYAIILQPDPNPDKPLTTPFKAYRGKTISGKRPQLEGSITWTWTTNPQGQQFLRERYFQVEGRGNVPTPLNPLKVRPILKSTTFVLFDHRMSDELQNGVRSYLTDFQIEARVKTFQNCPYCELLDRITLMSKKKKAYEGLNGQEICQTCAMTEVQRELKGREVHLTPAIVQYLQTLLQQSRSVPKVLQVLGGNQTYGTGSVVRDVEQLVGKLDQPRPLKELGKLVPDYVRSNLKTRGISSLLPAQVMALEGGLMQGKDLLIVAETSAGKTLVGEMAALRTILKQKKQVLYLSPLVALANTKYESFRKNFRQEGFKVGLRVGVPRLKLKGRKTRKDTRELSDKDIIVGTYEGFDLLLRAGQRFGRVGLVIIDEIQTLQEEDDRGPDLDGLISRVRMQRANIQVIGLSATIGNPEALAQMLDLKLVRYQGRPIPLEVHVLVSPSEIKKKDRIAEICLTEAKKKSSHGFYGQSIVFTNSRRKTKELRDYLRNARVRAANYHSGLPYGTRKKLEEDFDAGRVSTVVATYALGAGVDFPASTVIFESLQMGKDVLLDRANIFFQMMGRAGRLGKHDKGKVILLATPFPPNASVQMSELEIAMNLLKAKHELVDPEYDLNRTATQLLATLAGFQTLPTQKWQEGFDLLIGRVGTFEETALFLEKKGLTQRTGPDEWQVTSLGRAGALSFLTVDEVDFVQKRLPRTEPLDIAVLMEPFEGIHLAPYLMGFLEKALKTRVSSRLFSSNVLELLDSASVRVGKLDKQALNILVRWTQLFFNCEHKDKPYCDCGLVNVNKLLVQLRLEGYTPEAISNEIQRSYGLYAFPGDLMRWLESLLHRLEGIGKVAQAVRADAAEQVQQVTRQIQNPQPHKEAPVVVFHLPQEV